MEKHEKDTKRKSNESYFRQNLLRDFRQTSILHLTIMTFLILSTEIRLSSQVPFTVVKTVEVVPNPSNWPQASTNTSEIAGKLPPFAWTALKGICGDFGIATPGCECEWGKCISDRPSPSCKCPWGLCYHFRQEFCEEHETNKTAVAPPEEVEPDTSCGKLGFAEPNCSCSWGKCQSIRNHPLCACPWGRCMENRPPYCQQSQLPCVTSSPKFDVPQSKECACSWGNCQTERPTSACACPWGGCTSPRDQIKCQQLKENRPAESRGGGGTPRDTMTEWVMYGLASFLIILILSIVGFCLYQTRRRQRLPILQYTIEDFTIPADGRFGGDISCDCLIDEKAPSVYSTTGSLPSTSTDVDTDISNIVGRPDDDDEDEDDDDESLRKFGNLTPNQDLKIFEDSNFERKRKNSKGSRGSRSSRE